MTETTDARTPAEEQRDVAVAALHDITTIAETYDRDRAREAMGRVNRVGDDALARIAEIGKAAPPSGWRPIETAPKDGTTILVGRWDDGMPMIYSDHWSGAGECWCDSSPSFQPTHWVPLDTLPEPPQEKR